MVDPDRARRLLTALDEYRGQLTGLSDLPRQEYVEREAYAGRYLVQAAAQACIDLANHAISSEGWRTPSDFRDAFTVLEEHDVLEASLAERMRSLAGLRNRLVHVYAEVDDAIVHEALAEGLADLGGFAQAIGRLVEQDG